MKTPLVADLPQCTLAQRSGGLRLWCHLDALVCYVHRYNGVVTITLYCQPSHSPTFHSALFCYYVGGKLHKYFSQDLRYMHTDNTDTILGYKRRPI